MLNEHEREFMYTALDDFRVVRSVPLLLEGIDVSAD